MSELTKALRQIADVMSDDERSVRDLEDACNRLDELEAKVAELRQSLIGGVELVRRGVSLETWADANERLLARR